MKTIYIDWVGKRGIFFLISGALCAASLATIVTRGFNYGIDFTGGAMVQLTYDPPISVQDVRAALDRAGYPAAQPQSFGQGSYAIFLKQAEQDASALEAFLKKLQESSAKPGRVDRKEFVGPSVGRHLKRQAILAIVLALFGIIVYVAFRFDNPLWGAAGVAAIAHDVLITAGLFSALGLEVDLVIVAALLTIAGYSINDTIVIFDRLRDNMRHRRDSLGVLINDSVNEMQSRTLITNAMVIVVVLVLFLFGGAVIHNFALAMLVGSIVGTYSTVAICTSLVYQWHNWPRNPHQAPVKPKTARR